MQPLINIRVLTLALNVPGPVAATRLRELGAGVTKVEPPAGDPLAAASRSWYRLLTEGQEVLRLDLKSPADRRRFDPLLGDADLLLTASRPAALARLGLDWATLHARHPRLAQVAVVGGRGAQAETPGHDLTYQAGAGLLDPPTLPRTLLADLAGAERTVSAALALLLARQRGAPAGYAEVSLAQAAADFAAPLAHGLTAAGAVLGGGYALYNLYETREGWIALAALEPRFRERLAQALGLTEVTREALAQRFRTRRAEEWEAWARGHDLPLAVVRPPGQR